MECRQATLPLQFIAPTYIDSCKCAFPAQINFASLIISFFATSAFFHFLALVLGAFEVCWFWYWRCTRPTCPGLSRAADSASLALAGSWTTRSRGGAGPRRRAFEPFSKKPIRSRVHPTPFSVFNFCFNHGEFVVAFEPQVVSSSCSPQSYLCVLLRSGARHHVGHPRTKYGAHACCAQAFPCSAHTHACLCSWLPCSCSLGRPKPTAFSLSTSAGRRRTPTTPTQRH